jgi:hypothetical protein
MSTNTAEASIARACLAHPALDRLLSSAERIAMRVTKWTSG